jgi:hypothetical protein
MFTSQISQDDQAKAMLPSAKTPIYMNIYQSVLNKVQKSEKEFDKLSFGDNEFDKC